MNTERVLQNKKILVTGGSKGKGYAIANTCVNQNISEKMAKIDR